MQQLGADPLCIADDMLRSSDIDALEVVPGTVMLDGGGGVDDGLNILGHMLRQLRAGDVAVQDPDAVSEGTVMGVAKVMCQNLLQPRLTAPDQTPDGARLLPEIGIEDVGAKEAGGAGEQHVAQRFFDRDEALVDDIVLQQGLVFDKIRGIIDGLADIFPRKEAAQLPDGGMIEDILQGHLNALIVGLGNVFDGTQAVAAQLEEIVGNTDGFGIQQPLQNGTEDGLLLRFGSSVFPCADGQLRRW